MWQVDFKLVCIFAFLIGCKSFGLSESDSVVAEQPNIIYVFVDDLSSGMTGFSNVNSIPVTPNLDALAASGLRFNQAYANAICSPSRGTMYTGYHLGHTINDENVENFRSQDIMPGEMVKAAGYSTAVFGKWGFGSTTGAHTGDGGVGTLRLNPRVTNVDTLPTSHGYDVFVGYLNHVQAHRFFIDPLWQSDSTSSTGVGHFVTGNNAGDDVTNTFEGYTDDHHTREALTFISDNAATNTPFLIQMHFNSPHPPFEAGSELDSDFEGNPRVWDQDYQGLGLTLQQRQLAVMITRMDEHVGALVDHLQDPNSDGDDSDSILENTVILFTSDNGGEPTGGIAAAEWSELGGNDMNGIHLRGGKRDLFEGGLRVPTFAYWPGTIAGNQTTDEIIDLADFMPTVADLAGIDPPIGLDGVSYAGLLRGEGMFRRRNHHVWEHHERDGPDADTRDARWSVLKDNFKLIGFSNGSQDLYDLNVDPEETQTLDLAVFADLRQELQGIADAEGLTQPADGYSVQHVDWIGGDGGSTDDSSNWSGFHPVGELWVSVVDNQSPSESVISFGSRDFLGLELRGELGRQTARVEELATLSVRNELRIGANSRVQLDQANIETIRWVDVKLGGELTGSGSITGQLYNWGQIAPGLPADLESDSQPVGDVNTGVVDAIEFDFAGVQDDSPLNAFSSLGQYNSVSRGFQFGPGVARRGQANAGNEFNIAGWNTDDLPSAIAASDYMLFELDPIPGIEMLVDEVSMRLWRNGSGAARSYAIFVSPNGFEAMDPIGIWEEFFTVDDGSANNGSDGIGIQHQVVLTAENEETNWSSEPVEVRIYAWDTTSATSQGNTHLNALSMTAQFRSVEGDVVELSERGKLRLQGDFFHQAGASLLLQVAGVNNAGPDGYEFDQLVVDGTVELAGDLTIELLPEYQPVVGDAISLIRSDAIEGSFASVNVTGLPDDLDVELQIADGDAILTVVESAFLIGDLNRDSVVDLLDIAPMVALILSGGFQVEGDLNQDGTVDLLDIQPFVDLLLGQ